MSRGGVSVRRLKQVLRRVLPRPVPAAEDAHSRQTYAQVGEDIVTNFLVGDKPNGFYVDVGAHHPQRFSNTYFFYRRGWRGINIDALPGSMEPFRALRPRDINLEMGVAGTRGELTYHSFDEPAVNGFSPEISAVREGRFRLLSKTPVPTYPLAEVLDAHLPPGQAIDFLSVDVEGLDIEVLASNNWDKYRPRVVLAEELAVGSLEELHASPLTKLMASYGYVACSQCVHTHFYLEARLFEQVMRD